MVFAPNGDLPRYSDHNTSGSSHDSFHVVDRLLMHETPILKDLIQKEVSFAGLKYIKCSSLLLVHLFCLFFPTEPRTSSAAFSAPTRAPPQSVAHLARHPPPRARRRRRLRSPLAWHRNGGAGVVWRREVKKTLEVSLRSVERIWMDLWFLVSGSGC